MGAGRYTSCLWDKRFHINLCCCFMGWLVSDFIHQLENHVVSQDRLWLELFETSWELWQLHEQQAFCLHRLVFEFVVWRGSPQKPKNNFWHKAESQYVIIAYKHDRHDNIHPSTRCIVISIVFMIQLLDAQESQYQEILFWVGSIALGDVRDFNNDWIIHKGTSFNSLQWFLLRNSQLQLVICPGKRGTIILEN